MYMLPSWAVPFVYFGATIGLTALFAYVAGLVISGLMRKSNSLVRVGTRRLAVGIVWLVGLVIAVQQVGVGVDIVLLVAGLLGITGIVALRVPLENMAARYMSDVYSPFKIGDTIRVSGQAGRVLEINSMCTVILTEDDRLVSLPNSLFLRETVENLTPEAWKELVIPISVAGSVDLPTFESEILKALTKIRIRLDKRYPPVFSTKARSLQSTDLVLTVMVARPEDRDPVLTEVNTRVADILQKSRPGGSRPSPTPETPSAPAAKV
jgi:small conductance mechanosensitive channel